MKSTLPRPIVRSAWALAAAATLAALAVGSGGVASGLPSRDPCATKPAKGKPHAVAAVAATSGKPTVVNLRTLPKAKPSSPSQGAPRKVLRPSHQRTRTPNRTTATCLPHPTQVLSAPAKP
jgi:uncharacterized protein (DUF58 family)